MTSSTASLSWLTNRARLHGRYYGSAAQLNTAAQSIEPNKNKMSCRATTSPGQLHRRSAAFSDAELLCESRWSSTQRRMGRGCRAESMKQAELLVLVRFGRQRLFRIGMISIWIGCPVTSMSLSDT